MTEEFLQFIWENKLFDGGGHYTPQGDLVEIIHRGNRNQQSGPDYFNAKIRLNDTVWAGNVELHVKASDWFMHKHHQDEVYDNVILHVVANNDKEICRKNGDIIPVIELKYPKEIIENYDFLRNNRQWIPCQEVIGTVSQLFVDFWLNRILVERLESKTQAIAHILEENKNNWEETLYRVMARNFVFQANALPFEMLAASLPLKYLGKHKNNLVQVEALLFGQAGMLQGEGDEYFTQLKDEYKFLAHKFALQPIDKNMWKFMRLRPPNFPTIRIAQFAMLIHKSTGLFSKIIQAKDTKEFAVFFDIEASEYWHTHYTFNKTSQYKKKIIGNNAFQTIVINTIVPFIFIYGGMHGNEEISDKAQKILENLPAEKNTIINKWKQLGIEVPNAFYSQALLQLKNEYCDKEKCLHCEIGTKVIRNKATRHNIHR